MFNSNSDANGKIRHQRLAAARNRPVAGIWLFLVGATSVFRLIDDEQGVPEISPGNFMATGFALVEGNGPSLMAAMLTYRMACRRCLQRRAARVSLRRSRAPRRDGIFWTGIGALGYDRKDMDGSWPRLAGVTSITYNGPSNSRTLCFGVFGVNESDVARLSSTCAIILWHRCGSRVIASRTMEKVIFDPRRLAKVQFDMQVYRIDDDGKADIRHHRPACIYNLTRSVNEVVARTSKSVCSQRYRHGIRYEIQTKKIQWTRT